MVLLDAASTNATQGFGNTCTHPGDAPDGVLVQVLSVAPVTGVTYGGEDCTRIVDPVDGVGELSDQHLTAWLLPAGAPAGTQDVVVVGPTPGTAVIWCWTLTADAVLQLIDVASWSSASLANPSDTLELGGRAAFVALGMASGVGAPGDATELAGWSTNPPAGETDAGARIAGSYHYDTIGTVNVTVGWTQAADDALGVAVAIGEVVASGISASGGATLTLVSGGAASVQVRGSGAAAIALTQAGAASVLVRASGTGAIALAQSGSAALQVQGSGAAAITLGSAGAASVRVAGTGASPITLAQAGTAAIGDVPISAAGTSTITLASSGAATLQVRAAGGSMLVTGASGSAGAVVRAVGGSAFLTAAIGVGRVRVRASGVSALVLAQSGVVGEVPDWIVSASRTFSGPGPARTFDGAGPDRTFTGPGPSRIFR